MRAFLKIWVPMATLFGSATGLLGCEGDPVVQPMFVTTTGGDTAATGGLSLTGGTVITGGLVASGGITATGGIAATGGDSATGGIGATGGDSATGGIGATGGMAVTGGIGATGGASTTGGSSTTGGASATGGSSTTGGASATGGSSAAGVCGGATPHGCYTPQATNTAECPAQIPEQTEGFVVPLPEWVPCGTPGNVCAYDKPNNTVASCFCDLGVHWICAYGP